MLWRHLHGHNKNPISTSSHKESNLLVYILIIIFLFVFRSFFYFLLPPLSFSFATLIRVEHTIHCVFIVFAFQTAEKRKWKMKIVAGVFIYLFSVFHLPVVYRSNYSKEWVRVRATRCVILDWLETKHCILDGVLRTPFCSTYWGNGWGSTLSRVCLPIALHIFALSSVRALALAS